MADAYRLPRADIARIGRVVNAFESGEHQPRPSSSSLARGAGELRCILLERLDSESLDGDTKPARALALDVANNCWLLRVTASGEKHFHLSANDQETGELSASITAEELQTQLEGLGLDGQVNVVGLGMRFGPEADQLQWSDRSWFIGLSGDAAGLIFTANQSPGDHAEARIFKTRDFPQDRLESIYARHAGDLSLRAGSIVTCRAAAIGYRVLSATLYAPDPCPAQNAHNRVSLNGGPTGGTWGLTLRKFETDPETEQQLTVSETIEDLEWDCTAADLQAAIDGTEHFAEQIIVTGGPAHRTEFNLEYVDELGETDVPLPSVIWGSLEGVVPGGVCYRATIGRGKAVTA